MALSEIEQIKTLLEDSKYILIIFDPKDNGDGVASALALKTYLEKQHKQAEVASSGFATPKNLKFLPGSETIKSELAHLQKFIIKVDVSRAPIETLSYDVKDNWLSIYLTPKFGTISKEELRTAQSSFKYDLVITLNTPDLESLGPIFLNNTDLFYRTSIINIDHQSNNERYGQINMVDLTATSTAEVVYKLLKQLTGDHLDSDMATALLTGMTIATKSFKNPHITPITLTTASQLITSGADREKVVHNLYRTRSIASLKLWGEALTHLQSDPKYGLVWTSITRDDFVRSGATAEELHGIIDELISNAPEAKITLLLYETDSQEKPHIHGILAVEKVYDALELTKAFQGTGTKRQASFIISGKNLKETEELVIKRINEAVQVPGREMK